MKTIQLLFIFLVFFAYADSNDTKKIEMEVAKVYMDAYTTISVAQVVAVSTITAQEPGFDFMGIDKASVNPLRGRGQVVVIFEDKVGNQHKRIYRYDIDASIEASRAKTVIAKDQQIILDNIEPTLLKIGSFSDMPLVPSKVINNYSKRFIPKGSIIFQRDIGTLADVRKGQTLTVTYIQGAIEADMEAVALEDATIGQMINVKTKAGKILRVRVSGRDMAEIE